MVPEVSILLPVRDAAHTLATTLESVRRQRLEAWECVVVDDGSRDDSLALARRAAAQDPRIRVLARRAEGLVPALTAGLDACRAPLVARLDADDWMHRDRLVAQKACLDDAPELWAVGCHVRLFPRRTLRDGRRAYESWLNALDSPASIRRDRFVECPIAHPTLMIRTGRLRALGYRDLGWPEDYDLLLRLLAEGPRVGTVPRRLLGWRDHPERLSRNDPRYAIDRFTACRAHHLSRDFLHTPEGSTQGAPFVLWGHGRTGRALRRALNDLGHRMSAIVEVHPRRLGNTIHGAPVIPPDALRDRPREKIIVSVAGSAPRGEIRACLAGLGFVEDRDFVCAA